MTNQPKTTLQKFFEKFAMLKAAMAVPTEETEDEDCRITVVATKGEPGRLLLAYTTYEEDGSVASYTPLAALLSKPEIDALTPDLSKAGAVTCLFYTKLLELVKDVDGKLAIIRPDHFDPDKDGPCGNPDPDFSQWLDREYPAKV